MINNHSSICACTFFLFAVASHADSSIDVECGFGVFHVYSKPVSYGSVLLCEVKVGTTTSSDGKFFASKDFETPVIVIRGSSGIHVDIVVGASVSYGYISSD